MTGKDFKDDSWKAWATYHPADVQAADAQVWATRDSVTPGTQRLGSESLAANERRVKVCQEHSFMEPIKFVELDIASL